MDCSADIVLQYIDEVWNKGDISSLENLTSEDFEYCLGGQPARDRKGMRDFLLAVRSAFPDWTVKAENVIADGDSVAVRWTGEATHKGAFHGIPPTGKRIGVCGINIYTLTGGKISREWEQMDSVGMLQQLGAFPAG